jgi:hypothetical protein
MNSGSETLLLKITQLNERIVELEEIETDLNGTLSYAEMGVAMWKTRAEELEAEVILNQKENVKMVAVMVGVKKETIRSVDGYFNELEARIKAETGK